jgi:Protein of unknown function (DUF3363)
VGGSGPPQHRTPAQPRRHPGKDDLGKDLIVAQDYITDGVRLRAQERATLELGPESDLELREKLRAEISADRFTRIDRAMIEEAQDKALDLRPEAGQVRADFDRTLRLGRLQTLERYGLAAEASPGVWTISDRLEPTMRALGERGDIVKAINRALTHRGLERGMDRYVLHGEEMSQPVIGRVIAKRLTDELGDKVALIVDGVDGRTHYMALGDKTVAADAPMGSIVEIGRAPAGPRASDRNIAALAADAGIYRPSEHRAMAEAGHVRVPGGDFDGYVGSHVRRLEALRRAGVVERLDADYWSIPAGYEARATAYDATQSRRMNLRVLSAYDLDRQISSDGATWLDRELYQRHARRRDQPRQRQVCHDRRRSRLQPRALAVGPRATPRSASRRRRHARRRDRLDIRAYAGAWPMSLASLSLNAERRPFPRALAGAVGAPRENEKEKNVEPVCALCAHEIT